MTFGSAGQRGRWRLASLRREAERRQLETRHAMQVARHRRALRRTRATAVRYAVCTLVCVAGAVIAAGVAELCWTVAGIACAVETGLWSRKLVTRRRADPPTAPTLPHPMPAPPPRGSAAWPALRRLETTVTAIRRLTPALPGDLVDAARPAVDAARAAYETGRAQAGQIAATETALAIVAGTDRAELEQVRAGLLTELDLAVEAVEHLLTSCTRLIGARAGSDARGQLSVATAEVVARTYGLRAAALTTAHLDGQPVPHDSGGAIP